MNEPSAKGTLSRRTGQSADSGHRAEGTANTPATLKSRPASDR
ncbi:hypothetical protein OHT76_42590 [Streptomyces sp. NBC_00287]|nr:hypothetical protein [Streptomyces sp. NBC_00287]